jgi:hypothetical protein
MKYKVTNVYGIRGDSLHRTARGAIKEKRKREGDGWVVEDDKGARYTMDQGGRIYSDGIDCGAIKETIVKRGGLDAEWAKNHLIVLR